MGPVSNPTIPAGRPGRYNRSFGGLVGAMIVMVVVVVLAWVGLGLFRDDAEFEPTPIDYDASVQALVDNGAALAYPARVPDGWRVNNLEYDPDGPVFSLAMLTGSGDFVGVYHGREELETVPWFRKRVPSQVGTSASSRRRRYAPAGTSNPSETSVADPSSASTDTRTTCSSAGNIPVSTPCTRTPAGPSLRSDAKRRRCSPSSGRTTVSSVP